MNKYLPCPIIRTTNQFLSDCGTNVFPLLTVVNWFNNEHPAIGGSPARAWALKPTLHSKLCDLLYQDLVNQFTIKLLNDEQEPGVVV